MIDDKAFNELYHPVLIPRTMLKAVKSLLSSAFKKAAGSPLESVLLSLWLNHSAFSGLIERSGLPGHAVRNRYGNALILSLPPESLNRMAVFASKHHRRRTAGVFIWDGDWDRGEAVFRDTDRYALMSDIWENRQDLRKSRKYTELTEMIKRGTPYTEFNKNRSGIYLNTEGKVCKYLEIYLKFMQQLEVHGYDTSLEKDPVCIALDRDGRPVKTAKGLHRLAMAQILGMKSIPVMVRGVHRGWWEKTAGTEKDNNLKVMRAIEHLRQII